MRQNREPGLETRRSKWTLAPHRDTSHRPGLVGRMLQLGHASIPHPCKAAPSAAWQKGGVATKASKSNAERRHPTTLLLACSARDGSAGYLDGFLGDTTSRRRHSISDDTHGSFEKTVADASRHSHLPPRLDHIFISRLRRANSDPSFAIADDIKPGSLSPSSYVPSHPLPILATCSPLLGFKRLAVHGRRLGINGYDYIPPHSPAFLAASLTRRVRCVHSAVSPALSPACSPLKPMSPLTPLANTALNLALRGSHPGCPAATPTSRAEFDVLGALGVGGFGRVDHVRRRCDGTEFALKQVREPPQTLRD
jgi:hypothetical protein